MTNAEPTSTNFKHSRRDEKTTRRRTEESPYAGWMRRRGRPRHRTGSPRSPKEREPARSTSARSLTRTKTRTKEPAAEEDVIGATEATETAPITEAASITEAAASTTAAGTTTEAVPSTEAAPDHPREEDPEVEEDSEADEAEAPQIRTADEEEEEEDEEEEHRQGLKAKLRARPKAELKEETATTVVRRDISPGTATSHHYATPAEE